MQTGFSPIPSRTFSRRAFVTLLGAGAVGALGHRADAAVGGEALGAGVIGQSRVGEAACGPCALANALAHGDPATRARSGSCPGGSRGGARGSAHRPLRHEAVRNLRPRRGRYSPDAGLTADGHAVPGERRARRLGTAAARGEWLDAPGGEDERAHLRRVHGLLTASLARGLPPVVEMRAFSADPPARARRCVGQSVRALARARRRGTDDAAAAGERVFVPVRGFVHGAGDPGVRVRGTLPAVHGDARVLDAGRRHEGLALAVGSSVRVAQRAGPAVADPDGVRGTSGRSSP